ncbi:hypothetical protein [Variovorax rhizosphaerae]|uniref:SPW repeat-containing protein n=1 Tax=Variovorax rhizosphaerae TaxID=1836200 RepID=A0ABU8WWM9_9BURK
MPKSKLFFLIAAGMSAPAWFVNVGALPFTTQFIWIGGVILCALFGLAFRASGK